MTDEQRNRIQQLRSENYGYGRIAQILGLSENTVKSFCRRKGLGGVNGFMAPSDGSDQHVCQCCGTKVQQNPGRKVKKFCSDRCRNKWWNEHLDLVNRKANYDYVCPHCKKTFTVYGNANRKYCSHECYIADRFGGAQ